MKEPNWYTPVVRPGHRDFLGTDIKDTREANQTLALTIIATALVKIVNMLEADRNE